MDQDSAGRTQNATHILGRDGAAAGQSRPSVVFALRFGNDDGFVQKTFAQHRDLAAQELHGVARSFLAFKTLGERSAYPPRSSTEVRADFYDPSQENRQRVARFIAENQVRLVVFQGASPDEIDTRFYRKLGVRTANTENFSFDDTRRQPIPIQAAKILWRRFLQQNLHQIYIANSPGQADFLLRYVKLPRSRIRTVTNGIDTTHYTPGDRSAACRNLGLDPEITWIMAASQSRPEKRVDLLLRAARRVMDARPDVPIGFFYVGGGEKLDEWRELARSLLPGHACRFFGRQAELQTFYRAASVFIHGAIRESFGLVLAEAAASGLPVVTTTSYGPAEIVDHRRTGILIDRHDWDGFVEAILAYIDSPNLRETHGQAARDRCVLRYGIDRAAVEMADCLRPMLL